MSRRRLAAGRRASWCGAALVVMALFGVQAGCAADCEGLPGVRCDAGGPARLSVPASGGPSIKPLDNLGTQILPYRDQPGTLGAVAFQGDGRRCIGLLRRGVCK